MHSVFRMGRILVPTSMVLLFAWGACATADYPPRLSYYLAVKTEASYEGEPMPKGGVEPGPDWIADTYTTPGGTITHFLRKRTPEFYVPIEVIQEIRLSRSAPEVALHGHSAAVVAVLVIEPDARKGLEAFARDFQGNLILVAAEEESLGLMDVLPGLASAVPGGVFASEEAARTFYASTEDRLHVIPTSPEEVRAWQDYYQVLEFVVLWDLKCNAEYRDSIKQRGDDPDELLGQGGDKVAEIDCSSEPPEAPRPPSRSARRGEGVDRNETPE